MYQKKILHQLYLEEQFGANAPLEGQSNQSKKKSQKSGAAIGYSYDDSTENATESQQFAHIKHSSVGGSAPTGTTSAAIKPENESESESDSDMDMDVSIEVSKLDTNQAHELNACGRNYGGRKSRKRDGPKRKTYIARRPLSPPSYAAKEDNIGKDEDSDSRSPSPSDTTEKITYITSFGGEDELQPHSKITITLGKGSSTLGAACVGASTSGASGRTTYAQKVKENLEKLKQLNATTRRRERNYAALIQEDKEKDTEDHDHEHIQGLTLIPEQEENGTVTHQHHPQAEDPHHHYTQTTSRRESLNEVLRAFQYQDANLVAPSHPSTRSSKTKEAKTSLPVPH
ncbi:hypothetical protein EVAR_72231_1 [Eumeta japonica]|uniref:Uncharacterized protein n=1 Tax=Eumeta variegata TaxID=151549 RepID=A0A4C1TH29_EUMVA|nr:hypothetical protein EVAR_72231_1 [Eumeta japonica]